MQVFIFYYYQAKYLIKSTDLAMDTPIQSRRSFNLPLTIKGRSPWMILFMILWIIIVVFVPLLFKFVIFMDSFHPYVIFAVIMLFLAPAIFGKKKVARTAAPAATEAEAASAAAASTSDSRPRRSVDVEMEKFDYSESKDEVEDGSGQLCVICLCNDEEDEKPALSLPACRHIFHVACIQRWLQSNARCPICTASPIAQQGFSRTTDFVRVSVVVEVPESMEEERVDI